VSQGTGANSAITFHAEPANLSDGEMPRKSIQAWRCDHIFAGERCGFIVDAGCPSELRVCDHTWRACIDHGDYEVSTGRPRKHPDHFGGMPGALMRRGVS
jgi:hypothetical protein